MHTKKKCIPVFLFVCFGHVDKRAITNHAPIPHNITVKANSKIKQIPVIDNN